MKRISPDQALRQPGQLIDVRSESEYLASHIPGALNIPILDDLGRHEVGIVYREHGKEAAIQKGLEITSPVLSDIVNRFSQISGDLILYCARGGMRSASIAHLLQSFGRQVTVIEGGYKAYRNYVLAQLPGEIEKRHWVILQGNTGVSKTIILNELAQRGYSLLDLERLAKHSGSVFGHLTYPEAQPTQKQFENDLFQAIALAKDVILCESESRQIGRVILPAELIAAIQHGYHILLDTSFDHRIETILEMYANQLSQQKAGLIEAINHLRRRLSNEVTDRLIEQVEQNQLEAVIRYLMEHYYDPMYRRSVRRQDYDAISEIYFQTREEAIEQIIELIENHIY